MLPILKVNPDDIPAYAIVCGDPFRAAVIAERLEDVRELAHTREYRTYVGSIEGVPVAVVSHGVGCPGAAVCFEELARAGVKTIIRVGTAGSLTRKYPAGSLIVSTAAAREDGLTRQLVPSGFPAVADAAVTEALYEAAVAVHGVDAVGKGITLTLDAFFQGVEELPKAKYAQAGVLAIEMEISALYVVSALRGMRAGAIVALDGNADEVDDSYDPNRDMVHLAVDREITAALRAVVTLAGRDDS